MNSDEDRSLPVGDYRPSGNIKPTPVLDLGDIKTRSEVLRKRLDPIFDILVIANMKIERCINSDQDVPETLYLTRDKMYEIALEILKSEGL